MSETPEPIIRGLDKFREKPLESPEPVIRGLEKFSGASTSRLRMSEDLRPASEETVPSRLRLSEDLRHVADHVGASVVAKTAIIRGLDKFDGKVIEEEPGLIPKGYDFPPELAEQLARRTGNPDLQPFEDPEGIISPGLILVSPHDPDHRRLIAHMYTTPRGNRIVVAHIEGEKALRNTSLEAMREKIAEGRLVVPGRPSSEK